MKKTLISVIGPTAIGKTTLAIALANYFETDIISADSRQFYKEMKIGTAVPSEEELESAHHHFIQHKSIFESFSVGDFERDAIECLGQLFKEKDIVILVGGSGLYVDAITKGLDKFPEIKPEIREALNTKLESEGIQSLQEQLKQLDALYYEKVDIENPHRIIRALEICIGTGKPYSSFLNKEKSKRSFNIITIGILADREIIYERINKRVDIMMKEGLLAEAKSIYPNRQLNALRTVGYKELFNHFDGNFDIDFAVEEIKKNTRRFAKRQLTWFKKNKDTIWVNYQDDIETTIMQIEKQRNLLLNE